MNTGAIHAAGIERRSPKRGKGRTAYQMNIPRLWEAHRGFRVLQSAHISGSVGRNEGERQVSDDDDGGVWAVVDAWQSDLPRKR